MNLCGHAQMFRAVGVYSAEKSACRKPTREASGRTSLLPACKIASAANAKRAAWRKQHKRSSVASRKVWNRERNAYPAPLEGDGERELWIP